MDSTSNQDEQVKKIKKWLLILLLFARIWQGIWKGTVLRFGFDYLILRNSYINKTPDFHKKWTLR